MQQTTTDRTTIVRIAAAQRDGPLVVVTTPGQIQAGALTRLQITRGEGQVMALDATTNAQGEARLQVQAGASDTDLLVTVEAPALPAVRPTQFLAVVGTFDTPGSGLDLVVADQVVYVADTGAKDVAGLQVIDVQDPTHPVLLHAVHVVPNMGRSGGLTTSVAHRGDRLYVATRGGGDGNGTRLVVLDISQPRVPAFAADQDGNHILDVIVGSITFSDDGHLIRSIVVEGGLAYVLAVAQQPGTVGMLYVVDIVEDTRPHLLQAIALPVEEPTGVAVAGTVVYVGAGAAGVLIFEMRDPATPRLVGAVGDPDPAEPSTVAVVVGPVVAGRFAYLVETQPAPSTGEATESFVVLDLHDPLAPVRRGTVPLHGGSLARADAALAGGSRLAVAGTFAYVTRGTRGVQPVDISNPEAPRPVGAFTTPSLAVSIATADQLLYVTDAVFGLQVFQGPGPAEPDTDGDGSVDVFDAFPTDPTEQQDTDSDRRGEHADADDDNDGFPDAEELTATPPTDPLDPQQYPVTLPPATVAALTVDAATPVPVRARQGTPEAPYRSVTEALQVLRSGRAPQVHTLLLRPGRYAPSTTQEVFPLDFSDLAHLTLRGDDRDTTVLDAEFRGEGLVVRNGEDLVFAELTITHGKDGLIVSDSRNIVIQRIWARGNDGHGVRLLNTTGIMLHENRLEFNSLNGLGGSNAIETVVTQNVARENGSHGIALGGGSTGDIHDNVCERNGFAGINLFFGASGTITDNVTQDNILDGILVGEESHATRLSNNLIQGNGRRGINLRSGSRATITNNVITHNAETGIIASGRTSATITDNLVQHNGQPTNRNGIHITELSNAVLRDNTVTHSGRDGIGVLSTSEARISGGSSTQNARDGIRVGGGTNLPGRSTVTIGLDDVALLELSQNSGAGLRVVNDGSEAHTDSRQLVFRGNAGGNIVGNMVYIDPILLVI